MSRRTGLFAGAALGLSLVVAGLLSSFASSSPDGLERVAMDKGFSQKGEGAPSRKWTPFADYAIPGIADPRLAGASAGVLGALIVFGVAHVAAKSLKVKRKPFSSKGGVRDNAPPSQAVDEVL